MELLTNPDVWVALLTLTMLEIVLGIDNVIFISILADRLPPNQRRKARLLGLSLAMFMRIALLLAINWIANLTDTLFTIAGHDFSGRDLIMLGGGLFLIYKSVTEIHGRLEGTDHAVSTGKYASFSAVIIQILLLDIVFSLDSVTEIHGRLEGTDHAVSTGKYASFSAVIIQILLLDIVFSLDSVITAVGMADDIEVMITAVVIAVIVMLVASGPLSTFVSEHPTVKMLALSFLLLIGTSLVAEGWGFHISKGYIYSAMGFAVLVEVLNLRTKKSDGKTVQLHQPRIQAAEAAVERRSLP